MAECIEWTKYRLPFGYGQTTHRGKVRLAHRVAYIEAHGLELDDISGMVVMHRCDNPGCVNPDHLELGTRADNNRDMAAKGRGNHQKKTHCPRGHEYSEENTYTYGTNRQCRKCRVIKNRAYRARKKENL